MRSIFPHFGKLTTQQEERLNGCRGNLGERQEVEHFSLEQWPVDHPFRNTLWPTLNGIRNEARHRDRLQLRNAGESTSEAAPALPDTSAYWLERRIREANKKVLEERETSNAERWKRQALETAETLRHFFIDTPFQIPGKIVTWLGMFYISAGSLDGESVE